MKSNPLLALIPLVLLVSVPAQAHFKVEAPPDALMTNATGDPVGGNQKTGPCGAGSTPSNIVTQVRSGAKLHVKVRETVVHGGHYRVAVASDRKSFVTPTPVVDNNNNNCVSAPIQNPVVSPVVADGLFPHANVGGPKDYETDVTMPTTAGKYTVQIMEFMTPHAPPCFYFHCANVEVVDSDAGLGDGGVIVVDGGTSSSGGPDGDGGDPVDPADASSGGDPGSDPNANSSGGTRNTASPSTDGGCNSTGGATPSLVTMSVFAVMAASLFRGRRRRR